MKLLINLFSALSDFRALVACVPHSVPFRFPRKARVFNLLCLSFEHNIVMLSKLFRC